ncbi:MAG: hypothetical protein VXX85_06560 [Candidatus Margulisiibacteriota bacterium]|nr:hypothetical protein [Candidatus Margulisiibacteriota bacterium]
MKIPIIKTGVVFLTFAINSSNGFTQNSVKYNSANELNKKMFKDPIQDPSITMLNIHLPTSKITPSSLLHQKNQVMPCTTALKAFNSDGCQIEPNITSESFDSKPIKEIIIERTLITSLSTILLSLILPTVKGIGFTGTLSFNTSIGKSMKAIGPIVAFTVNAPELLNSIWNRLLPSNSNHQKNENFKVLTLAILKHLWIWAPENNLNALSTSVGQSTNDNILSTITRKSAHTLREALLIKCVAKNNCETVFQKLKSYGELALLQTIFDRIAFKASVNPVFTVISRFFYLMAVKEVIDFSSQLIRLFENNLTKFKKAPE